MDALQHDPRAGARTRVAVVFGGRSSEHAVSCLTARSVLAALDRSRFDVVAIGITRDGQWVLGSADEPALAATPGGAGLPEVDPTGLPVLLPQSGATLTVSPPAQPPRSLGAVDVVLPLLHGIYGEDGSLQGLLEMAGIRYVGSGVLASALAMDKAMTKTVLAAAGLPVGRWLVVHPAVGDSAGIADRVATLGYPVFVKPARAGSSFGVTRVATPAELPAALDAAAAHDPKVIVEAAVVGREIECGVLAPDTGGAGGTRPEVSVCGEIVIGSGRDHYDFEAKYLSDATRLAVPADLPQATADAARELAAQSFTTLGCEGLARVDMFLRPDGVLVVNEVNTMPGFTPTSMFPRLWAASGLSYPDLVSRLVDTAAARPLGLR
jgi:D-alanine-D-alanine ligase